MAFKTNNAGRTMVCVACNQELPEKNFAKTDGGKYFKKRCRTCVQDNNRRTFSNSYQQYLMRLGYSLKHNRTKQGYAWEITSEDLANIWEEQKGRCALTNIVMTHHRDGKGNKPFNASIDRITPEVGYLYDNVQLVCYSVNMMKGTLSPDEFFFWVKSIYEHACD